MRRAMAIAADRLDVAGGCGRSAGDGEPARLVPDDRERRAPRRDRVADDRDEAVAARLQLLVLPTPGEAEAVGPRRAGDALDAAQAPEARAPALAELGAALDPQRHGRCRAEPEAGERADGVAPRRADGRATRGSREDGRLQRQGSYELRCEGARARPRPRPRHERAVRAGSRAARARRYE